MSETEEPNPDAGGKENLEHAIDDATEAISVQARRLGELSEADASGDTVRLDQLVDVPVRVSVELGRARMTLGKLVQLTAGSLIELDREAHEPADILVNGKVVARGEIVTIDDAYGVRITSVES